VRVDLLTGRLAPAARARLRLVTLALGIAFLGIVIWVTTHSAITAFNYGRVSAVMLYPLWPPMLLIPAVLALMALVMAAALARQAKILHGPPSIAGRGSAGRPRVSEPLVGALLIGLMFLLFALGVEISLALGIVGVVGPALAQGLQRGPRRGGLDRVVERVELLVHRGAALRVHERHLAALGDRQGALHAVARWVASLPGGLAVASIFSCAIFAAISGSSVATAATIGMIAIPEMERRGYYRPLIFGSLAAGGTLGILIPPSIPMIIYGVMTETSIGHLYMAGMIPASSWPCSSRAS
jgi:TRAP-type uncharacterized transport system fused permease subunit